MTTLPLCEPRVLSDAQRVAANPGAYADRPSLIHLSHLLIASARGQTPRQTGATLARARGVRVLPIRMTPPGDA